MMITEADYFSIHVSFPKTARTQYLHSQGILRQEIDLKQSEKEKGKMVEEMVWGVPSCSAFPKFA